MCIPCAASLPPPTFDQTHRQPPPAAAFQPPQTAPTAGYTGRADRIAPLHLTPYIAFTISSTIFFASENNIIVLSRKNNSFSMPA